MPPSNPGPGTPRAGGAATNDLAQLREGAKQRASALLPELLERIDWPRPQLDAYREQALRKLLTDVAERSSWHRERLRNIDTAAFTLNDLPSLPVMTKADLMAHFDDIATDPRVTRERCEAHLETGELLLDNEFTVFASGGSSGFRALGAGTLGEAANGWAGIMRFVVRWAKRTGAFAGPPSTIVVGAGPGPHVSNVFGRLFGSGDAGAKVSVLDPLDDIVAALNQAKPDHIVVYASFIPKLLDEARAGRLRVRPRLLTAGAEPLLPEHEQAVAEHWGCPVFNSWGATEVGALGGGSGFESGMLLYDDRVIIEPVDAAVRPVRPGELAEKLFVTPLSSRVLPVIRYELTDQLTVLTEPACCGSSFTRTSNVVGRLDEQFVYAGGPTVHPHVFRNALARFGAIRDYQVKQTARGAELRVVAAGEFDAGRVRLEIADRLERLGLSEPAVSVTAVPELDRHRSSAKLRRFVPLDPETV